VRGPIRTTQRFYISDPGTFQAFNLERWVGVDQKLLEIGLEPSTSLGSRLKGIRAATMGVVSDSGLVGGTIALTTWFNPDESIKQRVVANNGWAAAETSANDVAPISPSLLLGGLDTVAAGVDDEVRRESVLGEDRGKFLMVGLLVASGARGGIRRALRDLVRVVVGDVGCQSTNRSGLAGSSKDLAKHFACRSKIGFLLHR